MILMTVILIESLMQHNNYAYKCGSEQALLGSRKKKNILCFRKADKHYVADRTY